MRRERRLPGGNDFDAVFREGTVINGPFFVLRYRGRTDTDQGRWGIAVGKKLAPRATERNLLRRRLKTEVGRLERITPGDYVVVAKNQLKTCDASTIRRELERVVRKLGKANEA